MKARSIVFAALAGVLGALSQVLAQPTITTQPTDLCVSLNGTAQLRVVARSSGGTLSCRWWHEAAEMDPTVNPSVAKNILLLSNATEAVSGSYYAVVADDNGSATSRVAKLTVNPTFSRVMDQPLTQQAKAWMGCNWGDYDGDGMLDLFVACTWAVYGEAVTSALYHNDGGGRFTQIFTNDVVKRRGTAWNGAWADYDNDGRLDLFLPRSEGANSAWYQNRGGGVFQETVLDGFSRLDLAWGDYDRDGSVDLFLPGQVIWEGRVQSYLYRNEGNGTFRRTSLKALGLDLPEPCSAVGCRWLDFNNDGRQDFAVSVVREGQEVFTFHLFQGTAEGRFVESDKGSLGKGVTALCTWGDYDNDGYLDALGAPFGVDLGRGEIVLHHNLEGLTFTNATQSAGLPRMRGANTASWGDYDNDGWLDLFVCHFAATNALFHNNGDGTFTAVDVGSPLHDETQHWCSAWADYDNDGYLDLFLVNGYGHATPNCLYHNNGGANAWLKVKLVGGAPRPGGSNRDGIGAKVQATANLHGRLLTQTRDIASASAWSAPQGLLAHFGLADAKQAELLRIEWPSGVVQELKDVAANQFLTIWEPPGLSAAVSADGSVRLSIGAEPNRPWRIEASTDLKDWQWVVTMISPTSQFQYTDLNAKGATCRFYRLVSAD